MAWSTVEHLSSAIESDLAEILPGMYKSPLHKLSVMVACLGETRSCNTMELAARLPLGTERDVSRHMWIERFLSAQTIKDMDVMEVLSRRLLAGSCARGQAIIACVDQTALDDTRAIGMVSARVGDRALPLFWTVKKTGGNIPIAEYLPLLARLRSCLPSQAKVIVMADRFHGVSEMIHACQGHGFGYRIRLKSNLLLQREGGEISIGDVAGLGGNGIASAELSGSGVITNIGYVHDKGHEEAWFIAMDVPPTRITTLEYGLRWGIEAMFSDCKSRGFNFQDTHLQRTDRISRMLLVITIALSWATANGQDAQKNSCSLAA